jgi:large subunit ribosomal protein L5
MAPRLMEKYTTEIRDKLVQEFSYTNPMEVPRVVKVTLNMGLGEAIQNPKLIGSCAKELGQIVGQRPIVNRAKKSISTYKLRQGMPIGVSVTLRRDRMWEFLDRLVNVALPRVRDFRGVNPKGFDGMGNFTLGLKEQIVFPEIDYDKVEKIKGMNISIVTTARTDDEARSLLASLGMPFRT